MTILFVYDDLGAIPAGIRRIIGASRFGDIVRRKRRLAEWIESVVGSRSGCEFVRLSSEDVLADLRQQIERLPGEAMIFRMPSSIVPLAEDIFSGMVAKLPYALDPVVYGLPAMADLPALLRRDDALMILGEQNAAARRKFFSGFERQALHVGGVQFVDISEISAFLAFMAGATEARHFNVTSMAAGNFRKWSRDIAKMRAEYRYFHVVDEEMKRYLLPTFGYQESDGGAEYSMEYLSVPDAALQMVHHTFNETSFTRLVDNFFAFVSSRERQDVGPEAVRQAAQRDIIDKLDRRIEELLDSAVGRQLDALLASCGPHGPLRQLVTRCRTILQQEVATSDTTYLALSHGDPCLSNILYNPEINLFRLIDPRGAEIREDAFMHPVYDLAKFSHSVIGGYDFVNCGLAECALDESMRLALALENDGPPAWMKAAFRTRLIEQGWNMRLVRAVEASLFLSMLPLHGDSPNKLPAFSIIAGSIIEELEQGGD